MKMKQAMAAAKYLISKNLCTCCEEFLEWDRTGTLPTGIVREINLLFREVDDYGGGSLRLIEGLVRTAAFERIANSPAGQVTCVVHNNREPEPR